MYFNYAIKMPGKLIFNTLFTGAAVAIVAALIYLVFYFIFGYFIAWQFPDLREYYTGSQKILSFISHMKNQLYTDPWLILFQVFRGIIWALIRCLSVRSIAVKTGIERYLLVGLILSTGLCTPLLLPNDFMQVNI